MASLISIFLVVALTVVLVGIMGSYWLEKRLSGDSDPGTARRRDGSSARVVDPGAPRLEGES